MCRAHRTLSIVLAIGFIIALASAAQAAVGDGYDGSMQIAFTGYTNEAPLTDFPALVALSNGTVGLFYYRDMLSPPNADLRFADVGGNELSYEIDTWDTSGVSFVWVKLPLLTNGVAITCYWSQAGVQIPVYSTNGTIWSSGYLSVHHLSAASGATAPDAAKKGYDGALVNMTNSNWVVGKIGRALAFNAADEGDEYVELPDGYSTFTNGLTVSAWVKCSTLVGYKTVLSIGNDQYNDIVWLGANYAANEAYIGDAVGGSAYMSVDGVYLSNQWVHMAFNCTTGEPGTCVAQFYGNGLAVAITNGFTAPTVFPRTNNFLGFDVWGDYMAGRLDEVQVSDLVRSPEWIWASYLNQNDPSTFAAYSPGIPEPTAAAAVVGCWLWAVRRRKRGD